MIHLRKRSKFNAVRVHLAGYSFDSKAEAERWQELRLAELGGYISDLQVHPVFHFIVNGEPVGKYEADFRYVGKGGASIVEDVKGVVTPVYRLKRALMWALYGVRILETSGSRKTQRSLRAVAMSNRCRERIRVPKMGGA